MLHRHGPGLTGNKVDTRCGGIATFEIESRWRDLIAQRQNREDCFRSAGRSEQMASCGFGGTHGNLPLAAEDRLDRLQFGNIANWRRRGMRVEVLDVAGFKAGLPQCAFHGAARTVAVLGS